MTWFSEAMSNAAFMLCIFLLAIVLLTIFQVSPNLTFDDAGYITLAHQFLNGTYSITSTPYGYGIAFIVLTSYLWGGLTFICFIGILVTCYFLLKHYYSTWVCIATVLAMELSAFMFLYSGRILPDMPLGLLLSLTAYITLIKPRYNLLAGFLFGFTIFFKFGGFMLPLLLAGYYCQALAIIVLLGIFLLAGFNTITKRHHGLSAFIFSACLAVLLYQMLLPAGTNVFMLAHSYDALQARLSQADLYSNSMLLPMLIGYYNVSNMLFAQLFPLGFVFVFALIASVLVMWQQRKDLKLASLALWASMLYLFFGTESLSSWVFITVVSRYFILFAPLLALMCGYFISWVYDSQALKMLSWKKKEVLILLLIIIIASNMPQYIFFGILHSIHFNFA